MQRDSARVLIDLDNVLSQTDPVIRSLIRRHTGRQLAREQVTEFDYSRVPSLTVLQYEDILHEFHKEKSVLAKPTAGARRAVKWLSSMFRVVIVSGRPSQFKPQTLRWLKKNRVEFDELIFSTNKSDLAKDSVFLVEDSGETAIAAARYCLVYLFDYPWNAFAKSPNIRRVDGWDGLLKDVKLRLSRALPQTSLFAAFQPSRALASIGHSS